MKWAVEAGKWSATSMKHPTVRVIDYSTASGDVNMCCYLGAYCRFQVPDNYINIYKNKPGYSTAHANRVIYLGMVSALDEGLGQVVTKLKADDSVLWNKTLLVFRYSCTAARHGLFAS